jgi:hypothetical protein
MSTSPSPHPPRPRLTVRVGVAGHRWDKLKRTDAKAIQERFHQVFDVVEEVVRAVRMDPEAGYLAPETTDPSTTPVSTGSDPETEVTRDDHGRRLAPAVLWVLSGLAEGADRLGAQVARSRASKWKLTAMLPYDRASYFDYFTVKKPLPDGTEADLQDGEAGFGQPDVASQAEFSELCTAAEQEGGIQQLNGIPRKSGAYEPLAKALCRNSDVVVVVWNNSFGGAGGTGDVVRQAADLGIPVVRIPMDGVGNPWVHQAGRDEQAKALGLRPLAEHFRRLLVAPKPFTEDVDLKDNPRESYFAQRPRSERAGRIYDLFFRALAGAGPKPGADSPVSGASRPRQETPQRARRRGERDHVQELKDKWEREWLAQGASHDLSRALSATGVYRHYAWASHLANYNGGRYRSLFLLNYMLSWLAVAAAATGIAFESAPFIPGVRTAAAVEVVLLICILGIYLFGNRHRFHSQWLDCRRLAEWIRVLPMLLPLSRTPVLGVDSDSGVSSQESWVDWMYRAVVREAGVLPISLNEQMVGAQGILAAGVLSGQIKYHDRTSRRNSRVDRILHGVTLPVFLVALGLAIYHLVGAFPNRLPRPERVELLFLPLALIIPAFAGAMHGLRNQGDFEATTIRSRRIRDRLIELERELNAMETPTVNGIAEIAVKTAGVMNTELSAWLVAYQSKEIQAV